MALLNLCGYIIELKNKMFNCIQNCFTQIAASMAWPGLTSPEHLDTQQISQRENNTRPRRRSIYTHSTMVMRELNSEEVVRELMVAYVEARRRYLTMEHIECCSIPPDTMSISARQLQLEQAVAVAKIQTTLIFIEMLKIFVETVKVVLNMLESSAPKKRVLKIQQFSCDVLPQQGELLHHIRSSALKQIQRANYLLPSHMH